MSEKTAKKKSRISTPDKPEEFQAHVRQFAKELAEGDDLGAVIRSQIRLESMVIEYIEQFVVRPEALNKVQHFSLWLTIADALGLAADLVAGLRKVGDLRNNYAHTPQESLTKAQVAKIYNSFSALQRNALKNTHAKMKKDYPTLPSSYLHLGPRDQFSMVILSLWGELVIEIRTAKAIGFVAERTKPPTR